VKDFIQVSNERVGVLVGPRRETLNKIEKETGTKIKVEENGVTIEGEALNVLNAKNIVTAIGRGFSPEKAFKLIDENYILEVVDLTVFKKKAETLKSRIIGAKGRTRELIEELTGTFVSVYGKTASIIGQMHEVPHAREAIMMLIEGKPHASVYKYLEGLQRLRY
jgi:ribosomal RNA assembly protein